MKIYICSYIENSYDLESHWYDYSYHLSKEGAVKAEENFKKSLIENKDQRMKDIMFEMEEVKKTNDTEEIECLIESLDWEENNDVFEHYEFKIYEKEVKE